MTREQCQRKIFQISIKLGVSPKLISTRLLSKEDKEDMLSGLINDEPLETAVKCWMAAGMPEYSCGNTEQYRPKPELPMNRYRGIGKSC